MNSLNRYVLRQLAVGMILVTVVLIGVMWLSQSLKSVDLIVNRGLSPGTLFYLTLLLLPNFLTIILPIALFVVVCFVYGKLITDRELVVMRSVGLSQFALAKPVFFLASVVVVFAYAVNIYLVPGSYEKFRELKWDISYHSSSIFLQEGAFNAVSDDVTVYIRERSADQQLRGILVHDDRNHEKPSTIMASRGALVQSDGKVRVVMFDGNRQEVDKATNKLSILTFDQHVFDLQNVRSVPTARYREPRERDLRELLSLDQDDLQNPNDYGKFVVEGHKRLTGPVYAFGYAIIAVAWLISGTIGRRSQSRRIAAAVAFFILVQASAMGLENVSAKNPELVPLLYPHALLPIIVGFLVMLHHPRRRKGATGALMRARPA
ncbi:MAG: LPS export ABC transporter permease LptF [Rhodospirillales bacterium]|jgi:lipopolysaccharide export system permease protein|nr:LPS export ABC transporter permease LptF [Rhodospirillales bacterium]